MSLRLLYRATRGELDQAFREMERPIAHAATGAIKDAADQIKREGRLAIGATGFSKKWQNALRVNVYPSRRESTGAALVAFHKIPYAGVFEHGAAIRGSPYLWLPVDSAPKRIAGRKMTPANYVRIVGPLRSVNRPGRPPMLAGRIGGGGSKITLGKLRAGQRSDTKRVRWVILFVGISIVKIRGRFNLAAVFERARADLGAGYLRNLETDVR